MKKSTLMIVAVFAVLCALVVWSQMQKPSKGITRISYGDLGTVDIDRLEISGPKPIKLHRENETWRVETGKAAEPNAVSRVLQAIPEIDSTDLVTESKDRFAELEVDDEKGIGVKAYSGKDLVADFVIGRSTPNGSYVRTGNSVYLVGRLYASTFSRDASSWLNRKLFSDKLADVTRVEIPFAKPPYVLVKQDNVWKLEDPSMLPKHFRFDNKAAGSFVSSLLNTRAKDILDKDPGTEITKLDEQAATLAFVIEEKQGEDTKTIRRELRLGAEVATPEAEAKDSKPSKAVYAQLVGSSDVVTLADYTAKRFYNKATDFRDKRLMEFDQTKVTGLSIRDGSLRLSLEKQGAEWKIGKSSENIPEDFVLDPNAVTRRLSGIANATGTKVVEGMSLAAAGLTSSSTKVVVTTEDGKKLSLVFGKKTKEEERDMFYARGNADALVYLLTKWSRENLTGGLETFKKSETPPGGMPNFDPAALSKLPPNVRAGLMKQLQQKRRQQEIIQRMQKQAQQKAAN